MSHLDKLIARSKSKPRDFSWDQLVRLLEALDYREVATDKTGGSRRRFLHDTAPAIMPHKPHPGSIVKMYVVHAVPRILIEEKLI